MDEFQELNRLMDSLAAQVALFVAGFGTGSYVFAQEMTLFLGNLIVDTLFNAIPISTASNSIIESYTLGVAIFIMAGIIQGVVIGYFLPEAFSFGYVCGDLLLLAILGKHLWDIAPPVIIGMIIASVTVIIGIYMRCSMKKERNYYQREW